MNTAKGLLMSNRGTPHLSLKVLHRALTCFACVAVSGSAWAQSSTLIEAIRVHRSGLAAMARRELDQCESSAPKLCASRERLSLLTGVLLLSEGDAAGAVAQLKKVKPPKRLEAYHGWYLGEAQSWSTSRAAAVKTLQKTKPAAPLWLQKKIDLRSAELWLDLGQASKAKPILEAIDDPGPEVLFDRSLARNATGDEVGARADWQALAVRFPAHPHAMSAQALLEAAENRPMVLSFENSMKRAQAQLAASATSGALETLRKAVLPSGLSGDALAKQQARMALFTGQALMLQGKNPEANAVLAEAIANGSSPIAAEAMMIKARRLMRAGDNAAARAMFQSVDAKYPNEYTADEAGYFGAWLAMGLGDDMAAAKAFETFEDHHPRSRRKDEARWFRGYVLFRAYDYTAARAVLASLVSSFPRSSLVPQARYWSARAGQLMPRPEGDAGLAAIDFAKEYAEVSSTFTGSFYALLSAERLRAMGTEVAPAFTVGPQTMTVPKTPALLTMAIELSAAGLLREAADEVQRAMGLVSGSDALEMGHALQAINEFGAAHSLAARSLWGAVYTQKQPEAVALMYPLAYQPSVVQYSSSAGLDSTLAWAIMRRESGFRTEVRSAADARGLMQIIPPTAKAIALEMKWPEPDPDELFAPATNIQMGTWYLAALMKRLGHVALAAAAYNAGPNAVVRWLGQRGNLPLDQWVEEIPYKETRGYVKQVVADMYIYQQLYGAPRTPFSFVLPAPNVTGVSF